MKQNKKPNTSKTILERIQAIGRKLLMLDLSFDDSFEISVNTIKNSGITINDQCP
ncbi:MAG: hypothetical protein ISP24_02810 [Rickettsiales bacterium]|nr:hypothetical protein [Rickettsiales bacterium]